MYKVKDIFDILNEISPLEKQKSWDNGGLLLGSLDSLFSQIVASLECTLEIAENAKENTLFIVHHPIIFSPMKRFNTDEYPAKILEILIKKNCTLIALHTSFDISHLNVFVGKEILGFDVIQDKFACYFEWNEDLESLVKFCSLKLNILNPRYVDSKNNIKKVALITGSGASFIDELDCDCLLTGDIKYHDAIKAQTIGISLIDIGHYESEIYFGKIIAEILQKFGFAVIIADYKNPFKILEK